MKKMENCGCVPTRCNDLRNTFHLACRQWYSYKNQGILT